MSTPETPRPLADRLHDHEPISAAESRALALLLWQVQHANRTAGVKGFDDAVHFALWTGIRDVYTHEPALAPTAPSSEDTPARVWQEGDDASWNGYHVKVVAAPPNVAVAITARGDVISVDPDALAVVPAGGEPA